MNWWSEAAILWLPVPQRPAVEDFASSPMPGSDGFYYLTLDAYEAVVRQRDREFDREPWMYVVEDQRILSPNEIDALLDEWRAQVDAAMATTMVFARGNHG